MKNKYIYMLILSSILCIPFVYSGTCQNGLSFYLKLTNTTATDFCGINNCTVSGAVYNTTIQAFMFDGVNDYISCTENGLDLTKNLTFLASFYPNKYPTGSNIMRAIMHVNYILDVGRGDQTKPQDFVITLLHSSYSSYPSTADFQLNQWQNFANVFSGNINNSQYRNGTLDITASTAYVLDSYSSPLYIGSNEGSGLWYQGGIKELRIYNRSLTEIEINSVFSGTDNDTYNPIPALNLKCFGDSICGEPPSSTHFCSLLGNTVLYDTTSYCYAGKTTTNSLNEIGNVLGSGANYTIYQFGTNDELTHINLNTTYTNIKSVVQQLKADGQKVLLSSVFPINDAIDPENRNSGNNVGNQSMTIKINSILKLVSFEEQVAYSDQFTEVFNSDWNTSEFEDFAHPNITSQHNLMYLKYYSDLQNYSTLFFNCSAFPSECYNSSYIYVSNETNITQSNISTSDLSISDSIYYFADRFFIILLFAIVTALIFLPMFIKIVGEFSFIYYMLLSVMSFILIFYTEDILQWFSMLYGLLSLYQLFKE